MSESESQEKHKGVARPVIAEDECKSCGRCVAACPKHCLYLAAHINRRGVRPVEYAGQGCIGCAICFYTCPEPYVIVVEKT